MFERRFLIPRTLSFVMSPSAIVLQGGEEVRIRTNKTLFEKLAAASRKGKIMVVPWTSDTKKKELEYRTLLQQYFTDSGFREVLFLEEDDTSADTRKKISSVDVVYLPGGDPEILYEKMKARSLENELINFEGTLVGNSAGAIVLSRGSYHDGKFYPGFGLIGFYVSVHYELGENVPSSTGLTPCINLPENMWVTVTT